MSVVATVVGVAAGGGLLVLAMAPMNAIRRWIRVTHCVAATTYFSGSALWAAAVFAEDPRARLSLAVPLLVSMIMTLGFAGSIRAIMKTRTWAELLDILTDADDRFPESRAARAWEVLATTSVAVAVVFAVLIA